MSDEKPKRGRPALDDPRIHSITVALSSREYQRMFEMAKREEKSMSAALRERALRRNKTTD
jgi:hypothetical protein